MSRTRDKDITQPIYTLPAIKDPIWHHGNEVVMLLHDFLSDRVVRRKRPTMRGLLAPERAAYPGVNRNG